MDSILWRNSWGVCCPPPANSQLYPALITAALMRSSAVVGVMPDTNNGGRANTSEYLFATASVPSRCCMSRGAKESRQDAACGNEDTPPSTGRSIHTLRPLRFMVFLASPTVL